MEEMVLRIGSKESYEAIKNFIATLPDVEIIELNAADSFFYSMEEDGGNNNELAEDQLLFDEETVRKSFPDLKDEPWMPGRPYTMKEFEAMIQQGLDDFATGNTYTFEEVKESMKRKIESSMKK